MPGEGSAYDDPRYLPPQDVLEQLVKAAQRALRLAKYDLPAVMKLVEAENAKLNGTRIELREPNKETGQVFSLVIQTAHQVSAMPQATMCVGGRDTAWG